MDAGPGQDKPNTKNDKQVMTFVPSPVPAVHVPVWGGGIMPAVSPVPIFVTTTEDKSKKKKKITEGDKNGTWERRYDNDGGKYWEHTGTKERRRTDPYY